MFNIDDWATIQMWVEFILPVVLIGVYFIHDVVSRYRMKSKCTKMKEVHLKECKGASFRIRKNLITNGNDVICTKCNKVIC